MAALGVVQPARDLASPLHRALRHRGRSGPRHLVAAYGRRGTVRLMGILLLLSEVVDRVRRTREPLTLTRNGRPAAVLVDAEEWALVSDLAERYEDLTAVREYDDAKAAGDGTWVTDEEILADLAVDEAAARRVR